MAGRWLDLRWALSVLCVLLMVETVPGARGPSTGAHISPQFPASGVNQTPVVDCRKVCGLNVSDRCDFIRTNPDCHSDGGYLDYLEGIFCHFPPHLLPLAVTLYVSWLLYLFLILGVTAAKLRWCAGYHGGGRRHHHPAPLHGRLQALLQGHCFLHGGCVPDLHHALPWQGHAAVGSGLPGLLCVLRGHCDSLYLDLPMATERILGLLHASYSSYDYGDEYWPLLFYQETTAQILARALNPLDYMKWRRKSAYWKALKVFKLPVEFLLLLTVPVVDPDRDDRNWKRPLNCLHLVISPLVIILTLQSGTYGVYEIGGLVPVWVVVVIAGTALASVTFFATSNSQTPRLHWLFAFLGFLTSALWINAAATEVVNILRSLGVVFRLSNTVLGLTLLAWGNSIGDAFSDFTLARQGYPRMAFSACFGGIIFNILVGVGLGCLLQISRSHTDVKLEPDGLLVWVLAGALGLSLVFSLVSVPLQCFRLSRVYGFCLLLFYLNFLVVALLTEFGVIHLKSM
ncbi:mitochondrial sodium/calcium exchanger protein isoform X6 [Callithrix jacchus]|uniref:mitochondrial sodium/calcium exchanger protein isoform X5 n=1 Tax=Callithrix jacchus TaxID=9483 RepID=UPI00159D6B75|nr:mitochondrial sodium/calcium exchanger protein isoform X5 [Callithrix jacchus]